MKAFLNPNCFINPTRTGLVGPRCQIYFKN